MEPDLYRTFYEIEDTFWWSVGTRRVFYDLINRHLQVPDPRVLDVGCGTGILLQEYPFPGRLYGCDLSDLSLHYCRERGLRNLIRCGATDLPFRDGDFDLVLALDVIEHLDDDGGCVAELVRVCRPQGHLLLHVPAFPILWTDKDDLNHHRRRYHRRELLELVERAGLEVVQIRHLMTFLFPVGLARSLLQKLRHGGSAAQPIGAGDLDRLYRIPAAVNRVMLGMMELERRILLRFPIPFGMSLVCVARKPENHR